MEILSHLFDPVPFPKPHQGKLELKRKRTGEAQELTKREEATAEQCGLVVPIVDEQLRTEVHLRLLGEYQRFVAKFCGEEGVQILDIQFLNNFVSVAIGSDRLLHLFPTYAIGVCFTYQEGGYTPQFLKQIECFTLDDARTPMPSLVKKYSELLRNEEIRVISVRGRPFWVEQLPLFFFDNTHYPSFAVKPATAPKPRPRGLGDAMVSYLELKTGRYFYRVNNDPPVPIDPMWLNKAAPRVQARIERGEPMLYCGNTEFHAKDIPLQCVQRCAVPHCRCWNNGYMGFCTHCSCLVHSCPYNCGVCFYTGKHASELTRAYRQSFPRHIRDCHAFVEEEYLAHSSHTKAEREEVIRLGIEEKAKDEAWKELLEC